MRFGGVQGVRREEKRIVGDTFVKGWIMGVIGGG